MLKDITIGQYYPANSIIHKVDARVKLIGTFVFMLSLFIIKDFWPYILVVLALMGVITQSKIPTKYILKGVKPLKWIILFTMVINIFFIPGTVIGSLVFLR